MIKKINKNNIYKTFKKCKTVSVTYQGCNNLKSLIKTIGTARYILLCTLLSYAKSYLNIEGVWNMIDDILSLEHLTKLATIRFMDSNFASVILLIFSRFNVLSLYFLSLFVTSSCCIITYGIEYANFAFLHLV